ncbi:hypothetical protein AB751O23_AI_00170 [Chlamydiales bacterium SCGC AB-751-O23]|nr:hypothetical protein AB751O23_AI_00170 [Chlamydiales bacterium SCGC AB-751-O23]
MLIAESLSKPLVSSGAEDLKSLEPYFLPESHPAYSILRKVFTKAVGPLTSEKSLAALGFKFSQSERRRDRNKTIVSTHTSEQLKNYVFKCYVYPKVKADSKDCNRQAHVRERRIRNRVKFSRRAREVVDKFNLKKYFFVPRKYLFPLKKIKGEKLTRCLLLEDKISFATEEDHRAFWRGKEIYEYLIPLARILWHTQIWDLQPANLRQNLKQQMTLHDTELGHKRPKGRGKGKGIDDFFDILSDKLLPSNISIGLDELHQKWREAYEEVSQEKPLELKNK